MVLCMRSPFLIIIFCFVTFFANAQDSAKVFTVEDVRVDVSADSAVEAQEKAFFIAQAMAFKKLAKRVLGEDSAKALDFDSNDISSLVKDFEVTGERFSATRYVGTYTFRFRPDATRDFFEGKNLKYTDMSAEPVLILPFYQISGRQKMLLWSDENPWLAAWRNSDLANTSSGLVPVIVPIGDVQDIQSINSDSGLVYDVRSLSDMLARYGADEAVIVLATDSPDKSIDVHFYRTDGLGAVYVKSMQHLNSYDDGVLSVIKELQSDWKEKMSVPAISSEKQIRAVAYFNGLNEWASLQGAINAFETRGANKALVSSMSTKSAEIDLMFSGGVERLKTELEMSGLELIENDVIDVISADPLVGTDGNNFYELRLK